MAERVIHLLGSPIQMSSPSPLTRARAYEVYVHGPVGAITDRFGSRSSYRYGAQYLAAIVEFPSPSDAFKADAGFMESGSTTLKLSAPENDDFGVAARLFTLAADWRNRLVDLKLVTRTTREDGSAVEIVNERRAAVKATKRESNVLSLELVDLDRSALSALVPSKTYKVADFPNLYTDHVGRAVPQVVGDALKVPLTYVDNTPGSFRYLACEVLSDGVPTVRTVYRNGQIVTPAEYAVDTVMVSGTTYLRVTFTNEQRDFSNALYNLDADIFGPSSRAVSDEIQRILALQGRAADTVSFAVASPYCFSNRMLVDCGHVTQREGTAIIEDLLMVARAQLYPKPDGSLAIFVDKPRDCRARFDDGTNLVQIDSYEQPPVEKTFTLQYRPSSSQKSDLVGNLQRTTGGIAGEKVFKNAYVRDHEVADRLLCYLTKRANARANAAGTIYGQQFQAGDVVAVDSAVSWSGTKLLASPQISRPADANAVMFQEYLEGVYAYDAGALPADATNGYTPDASLTPPDAPTGLAILSQGAKVDSDGKVTAYVQLTAVPPATNWAQLWVLVSDDTTGEQYLLQLQLNGASYSGTVGGLRPGANHHAIAWAVNSFNTEGIASASIPFTSATSSLVPSAPASVTAAQSESKKINYTWSVVAPAAGAAPIDTYILEHSVNGGAYAEIFRGNATGYQFGGAVVASTYQPRVKVVDRNQNAGPYVTGAVYTAAKQIDDGHIIPTGISGPSIANGSINQGRSATSTGSAAGNIPSAITHNLQISMSVYTFFPQLYANPTGQIKIGPGTTAFGNDTGCFLLMEDPAFSNTAYDVRWRNFTP